MKAHAIHVLVEQADAGDARETLHQDWRVVDPRMTRERVVRMMLARAAEQFPDREAKAGGRRHD